MKHLLCLILLLTSSVALATESQKLNQLLDDIWQWEITNDPMLASRAGLNLKPNKLEDLSPASLQRRHEAAKRFMKKLENIKKPKLPTSDQISLSVQMLRLQNKIGRKKYSPWNPIPPLHLNTVARRYLH